MVSTAAPDIEVKEKTFQPPSSQWISLARDRWVRYPVGDAGCQRPYVMALAAFRAPFPGFFLI